MEQTGRPMTLWKGNCYAHVKFRREQMEALRAEFADPEIVVHPESLAEVRDIADVVCEIAEVWRRGSVIGSWLLDLTAAGVIRHWRRWCLNPDYSAGAEGAAARQRYAAVRFPIRSLSIADDEMMTERGIENLLALYDAAPRTLQRVTPTDAGLSRIGHFGVFVPSRSACYGRAWNNG